MDEMTKLENRIRELEAVAEEHEYLKQILTDAKNNKILDSYTNLSLEHNLLSSKIISVTPELADLLGYTVSELINLHISAIEVDVSQSPKITKKSLKEAVVYECQYRHKKGFLIPIRVHQRPIEQDNQIGVQYTLVDLSIRSELVRELSRREDKGFHFGEKLKTLTEVSIDLGRIRSFDELCRRSIELAMTRLGFDRLSLWLLEDDGYMHGTFGVDEKGNIRDERDQSWKLNDTYVDYFLEGHQDPVTIKKNAPIYNNKSEIIAYGWHISVPLVDNNQFMGFIGADNFFTQAPLKDYQPELLRLYGITLGHLLVHNMERSKIRKLSDAIENSASMVTILDENGDIEFVNQAFCQLFDTKSEELIGLHLNTLLPQEDFPDVWFAIANNADWRGELVHETKDNIKRHTLIAVSVIDLNDSINYVIVQEDITDMKLLQEKEYLFQREQDRFEVLDEFLQDIGHEFRTPLSIISTNTYIINKKNNGAYQERFSVINEQVNYINHMVNSMLDIVKMSRGVDLSFQKTDLNEFIKQIVHSFENDISKKGLSYQLHLLPDMKIASLDPLELGRAISEILKNAICYTETGGQITISLNAYIYGVGILIKDTGIGIDEVDVQKIFSRFYRVNSARTTRGTGLGLSIAMAIVNAHDGDINVTSQLGEGSTFEVLLPI